MRNAKHFFAIRIIALLMVLTLALPVGVSAATIDPVQPCASDYLDSYNAYVYPAGNGQIQVWFTVTGVDNLDTLGAISIRLYESTDNINWTWVKSYSCGDYPNMMGYDDFYYDGHVDYQGIAGRYYKAYVGIWGGNDGNGDTRYFYTSSRLAT